MSVLAKVISGKVERPVSCLLYGTDGVGKSTFGACAPSPIFIGPESGTAHLNVSRLETKTAEEFTEALMGLLTEPHDFKTVVVDSLDWLEPLVWAKVCSDNGWTSIEAPGYGKGHAIALKEWQSIKDLLTRVRDERKINILLIAHAQIKTFTDPALNIPYDRYQLKLNEKAGALFREFVDDVLFANFVTFATKGDGKKGTAFGDGSRKIFTERRPAFDAKNRSGLPFEIPLSWDEYVGAPKVAVDPNELQAQILQLVPQIKNEKVLTNVKKRLKEFEGNVEKLTQLKNKVLDYAGGAA